MFQNFPYTDMHQLNLDWIIKIAKDFLDQYTHIQQLISDGETSLQNLTNEGLQQLQDKADNLETLLQEWYNTHSQDIADQLAAAIADLNEWYTTHENYLDATLASNIAEFNRLATAKAQETLEDIPDDYTALDTLVKQTVKKITPVRNLYNKNTAKDGYLYYYSDGSLRTSSDGYSASEFIEIEPSTAYGFNVVAHVCYWDQNMDYISGEIHGDGFRYVTTPATAKYITLSVQNKDLALLTLGPSLVPYDAYNDELTFNRDFQIGQNLFNKNVLIQGSYYSYSTGNLNPDSSYYASEFIPAKPNTTYGLNVVAHICYWDEKATFISGSVKGDNFNTFTTPANTAYITISVQEPDKAILIEGNQEPKYSNYHKDFSYNKFAPYQSGYIYRTFKTPESRMLPTSLVNNTAFLKLPVSYSPTGAPTKFCIICHGASMGISAAGNDWTHDNKYNALVTALNNDGYAVMDVTGFNDATTAGHDHWSCPQAIAGYKKAYQYFIDNYNLEHEVYLYGFSMGGLTALNIARMDTIPIKCVQIGVPVISIYDECITMGDAGTQQNLFTAYSMQSYDRTIMQGLDAYNSIVTIGNNKYCFDNVHSMRMFYGTADTVVNNTIIQEYYDALYNANKNVSISSYTGEHDIGYGGDANVTGDILRWFNKFN